MQTGQLLYMPAVATHRLLADAQLLGDLLQLLVIQDVGQLLGVLVAVSHAVRGAQGGVGSDVHVLQGGTQSVHCPPSWQLCQQRPGWESAEVCRWCKQGLTELSWLSQRVNKRGRGQAAAPAHTGSVSLQQLRTVCRSFLLLSCAEG